MVKGQILPHARRGLPRQPLDRYEVERATSASQAQELVLTSFPGLIHFSFADTERKLLSSARVKLDDVVLSTVRSSGHDIWLADDDRIAVLVPLTGTIEVSRGSEIRSARAPELVLVGTGERRTKLSPDYLGILLKIPSQLFNQRLRQLTQSEVRMPEGPGISSASELASTLRRYLLLLLEEFEQSDRLLGYQQGLTASKTLLLDLVAGVWIDRANNSTAKAAYTEPALIKRAEQFIAANLANPVSVADISAATGVSLRALQSAFRKYRHTTPQAFLTERRLQNVHDLLARGQLGDTVTSLAYGSGLIHLGRFARAYSLRLASCHRRRCSARNENADAASGHGVVVGL